MTDAKADAMREAITAQNAATSHAIAHRHELARRDAAVFAASEAGATYAELGDLLGLHEARIKQILTRQRRARR